MVQRPLRVAYRDDPTGWHHPVKPSLAVDGHHVVVTVIAINHSEPLVEERACDDLAVEVPTVTMDRGGGLSVLPDVATHPKTRCPHDRDACEFQRVRDHDRSPTPHENGVENRPRQRPQTRGRRQPTRLTHPMPPAPGE